MFDLTLFAERLDALMFEKGVNAPTLAKELNIDRTTVNRYLSGKKIPSLVLVVALADFFGCTTDYLLGVENESHAQLFNRCPPFAERFPYLLEHFHTNKYRLQKGTGIAESVIYYWQNGRYAPTTDNAVRLAQYFGCSVDFVLGREN